MTEMVPSAFHCTTRAHGLLLVPFLFGFSHVGSGEFYFCTHVIVHNRLESYELNLRLLCTVLGHMYIFFNFGIKNFQKYIFRITAVEDLFILVCTNIDFWLGFFDKL